VESVRPEGTAVAAADPEMTLIVGIGLPRDDAGLADLADAVSDPVSPSYGDFIAADEVGARFGADEATIDGITGFLGGAGIESSVDASRALVIAPMTVAQASRMFDTEFAVFENGSGTELIETIRSPSVPEGLADAQEIVGFEEPVVEPTAASLVVVPHSGATGSLVEPCDDAVGMAAADLGDVMSAYGIDRLHDGGFTGEGRSAALITVSTFDQVAIDDYIACFGIDVVEPTLHVVESGQPHPPTGEAAMDIELLSAIAPDLDRIDVFQTTAHGLAAPVMAIAAATDPANTGGTPPDVLSASLGWCEGGIPDHVLDLLAHYLLVAAAIGTTVVSAAGNHGTAGCYPASTSSDPHFPASSPWVLAVGGTTLDLGDGDLGDGDAGGANISESAWNDGSTLAGGGGISGRYDRPTWQESLVDADGRAYPDVALLADSATGYAVSYCPAPDECGWTAFGGTSAATPIAAGALALVNQARNERGLARLGLVTPRIYLEAASETGRGDPIVARDVTIGDNRLFDLDCCEAHAGLDQTSGWGALDFAAIAALPD
jgi:subtilase family serine protease